MLQRDFEQEASPRHFFSKRPPEVGIMPNHWITERESRYSSDPAESAQAHPSSRAAPSNVWFGN
jgi:hypothetical protein